MEHLIKRLDEHILDEKVRFATITDDIKAIKDNHLSHMQVAVEQLSTDMGWVKKAIEDTPSKNDMWWVKFLITTTLIALIGGFITVLFTKLTK